MFPLRFGTSSMADEQDDPREVAWHPRHATQLVGHVAASNQFYKAFDSGRPHHAWLITGPKGVGKATLAYRMAGYVLGQHNMAQSARWIAARSHPDLMVLERKLGDSKPRKLKSEISVDDARALSEFFSHTSSGSWRLGLVDSADDLSTESANALLKLVEEPPLRCLLLLVCNSPSRLLRTMKSRCTRLPLEALSEPETLNVLNSLPLEPKVKPEDLARVAKLYAGSPGRALSLLNSEAAEAFQAFLKLPRNQSSSIIEIGNRFTGRGVSTDDFNTFAEMLLEWTATKARDSQHFALAQAHSKISENIRIANAFNLDRRQAVIASVILVQEALKTA
jgi:DNA polymerase III subunit delta'